MTAILVQVRPRHRLVQQRATASFTTIGTPRQALAYLADSVLTLLPEVWCAPVPMQTM